MVNKGFLLSLTVCWFARVCYVCRANPGPNNANRQHSRADRQHSKIMPCSYLSPASTAITH